jgi:Flp pilus assembly protein TadG
MKNRLTSARLRCESGQAAVELALVLPVLLLLMVGILEFARAWNLHQVMTDAVREGARRAALADGAPIDSVYTPMEHYLKQFNYDPTEATMTVAPMADFKMTDKKITVTLALPYKIWVVGSHAFTMKSSLTVRNE